MATSGRPRAGWDLEFMSNLGHIGSGELAELNAAFAGAAEEPEGGGIGLRSVWYRLRLFYGGRVDMRMENCEPSASPCTSAFTGR